MKLLNTALHQLNLDQSSLVKEHPVPFTVEFVDDDRRSFRPLDPLLGRAVPAIYRPATTVRSLPSTQTPHHTPASPPLSFRSDMAPRCYCFLMWVWWLPLMLAGAEEQDGCSPKKCGDLTIASPYSGAHTSWSQKARAAPPISRSTASTTTPLRSSGTPCPSTRPSR